MLCAGAPINPGDTSDAMLQAALRITTIDTPFVLRQGVQTGRVFAGFLGSANRRTYTLMGDPVNTAARMLGKAGDRDVVAVASVVAGTRTVFVSEPLVPIEATPDETGRRLTEIVTALAPKLRPMLPLLAVPFGAAVHTTPEADAIDPQFRRARIHAVVPDFLDATLRGLTLLVVEDAHWIDDASGELVNHLIGVAAERTWTAIITRRPEGTWTIADADHVRRLELEPLSAEAIKALAIEASGRALADRDVAVIVERASGNPLFAIELARAIASSGGDVPDTIERIIASRIDQLAPATRRLVRTAAVLGTQFDEAILRAVYDADDGAGGASLREGQGSIRPADTSQSPNRSIQVSDGSPCVRIPNPWPPRAYTCSSAGSSALRHRS